MTNLEMSRRSFVSKGIAASGVAVLGAAGVSANAGEVPEAPVWDRETEVLVLGAGGAGMRAAYEARQAGCDVIILEKDKTYGGTSIGSAGMIQAAGTHVQKELAGVEDDTPEAMAELYMLMGEGSVEEELITDMCQHSAEHIKFFEDLGLEFTYMSSVAHIPASDEAGIVIPKRIHKTENGGFDLFTALVEATEAAGVEFVYNTCARELIQDGQGNVIGVLATDENGDDLRVKASKAVIICTSGIDHNAEMAKMLSPQLSWDLEYAEPLTRATDTGDGIRMGMAIGAMGRNFGGTMDFTQRSRWGYSGESQNGPMIMVNKYGNRFVCEDCTYSFTARAVFQETMKTGYDCYTIVGATSSLESAANNNIQGMSYKPAITLDELEAGVEEGWVSKGETLEELGEAIGVNPTNLARTVDDWNSDVLAGADRMGRVSGLGTIEGPYYAFTEDRGRNIGAMGGLAINVNAQVLDTEGNVIPHLYCAGAASGGWMGGFYPGSGTSLLAGQNFGWRAGVNAAAEEPLA